MRITITGKRGEGKTTVAVEIARLLESMGAEVSFETRSPKQSALLKAKASLGEKMLKLGKPMQLTIVDK